VGGLEVTAMQEVTSSKERKLTTTDSLDIETLVEASIRPKSGPFLNVHTITVHIWPILCNHADEHVDPDMRSFETWLGNSPLL
jgi:hypothetical protein